MLWFTKSRRAQNVDDYETWIEGGVMPTLNAFDNGDVRTTILVVYPIHDKATRFNGKRKLHNGEYAADGAGNGLGIGKEGAPMNTLTGGDRHAVGITNALGFDEWNDGAVSTIHHTLRAAGKHSTGGLDNGRIRRLTPVETERLQGFPDDWTEGQADSHRYKQMGNAVSVPVAQWIGSRL